MPSFMWKLMMLNSLHCPYCLSEHVEDYSHYETKNNGNDALSSTIGFFSIGGGYR